MSILTPKTKLERRRRRHARVRAKAVGTSTRPRLSVSHSNKRFYVQLIDDVAGNTIASAHSLGVSGKTLTEQASIVGKHIAKKAKELNITRVVFDRGGFTYAGRIK